MADILYPQRIVKVVYPANVPDGAMFKIIRQHFDELPDGDYVQVIDEAELIAVSVNGDCRAPWAEPPLGELETGKTEPAGTSGPGWPD